MFKLRQGPTQSVLCTPKCTISIVCRVFSLQFEQENQRLVSEMSSLVDEVRWDVFESSERQGYPVGLTNQSTSNMLSGKSRARWWRSLDSRRSLLRRSSSRWVLQEQVLIHEYTCKGRKWCLCTHFFPQETEIDSIHQLVVGTTENVKEGNEDIREVNSTTLVLINHSYRPPHLVLQPATFTWPTFFM